MKLTEIDQLEVNDSVYIILLDHPLAVEDDRLELQEPFFVVGGQAKLKKFTNGRYAELDILPNLSWNFSSKDGFDYGTPKGRYQPGVLVCSSYIEKGYEDCLDGRNDEVLREYRLLVTDQVDTFNSQLDRMIEPIEEELNRKIKQLKNSKISPTVHPLIKKS